MFCVFDLCPVFTAGLLLLLLLLCFSAVIFVFDTFLFADLCMCFFVDSRLRFFVNSCWCFLVDLCLRFLCFVWCVLDLSCFHGWTFVVVAFVVLFCCAICV